MSEEVEPVPDLDPGPEPRQPPVDWSTVRRMGVREAGVLIRSRDWARLSAWTVLLANGLALLPGFYRTVPGHWRVPSGMDWLIAWALGTAAALYAAPAAWLRRRLGREVRAGWMEDLFLAGCSVRDVFLGKALAASLLCTLLAAACFPGALVAGGLGRLDLVGVFRLELTLALCAVGGAVFALTAPPFKSGAAYTSLVGCLWPLLGCLRALGNLYPPLQAVMAWVMAQVVAYNPVSAVLAACGFHRERWGLGTFVLVVIVAGGLERLRRVSLAGTEELQKPVLPDVPVFLYATDRHWATRRRRPPRDRSPKPAPPEAEALARWEALLTPRLRIGASVLVPTYLLAGLGLILPLGMAGRWVFAFALWAASLIVAHNAAAAVAREYEQDRWTDLALTPLPDRTLLLGKLRPLLRLARFPLAFILVALVAGIVRPPHPEPAWIAWSLLAAALVPAGSALLGAWLAAVTRGAEETHWRLGLLLTGLPFGLTVAAVAGLPVLTPGELWPLSAAMLSTLAGAVDLYCWTGLLFWTAAAAALYFRLSSRIRELVLSGR